MNEKTVQIISALAFLLIGLFLLADQLTILLNINIANVVRAIIILAGLVSLIAGIVLFLDTRRQD